MTEYHNQRSEPDLLALPPEILCIILSYSLNPHLIHSCRRLRDTLPSFVRWTKALAAIATCLSDPARYPFSLYKEYGSVLARYQSDCGLPMTPSRNRDIREAVLLSTWFKPSHFRDTILTLYYAMPDDLHAFDVARHQFDASSGVPVATRTRRHDNVGEHFDVFKLDQFSVAISNLNGWPRKQSVKIWLTADDGIEPTAIGDVSMPHTRKSKTAEAMVLAFIWARNTQPSTPSNVEAIQDGLVYRILSKSTHYVNCDLWQQRNSHQPGLFGGVEWKHVVLAAKYSRAEIMKLLLDRHVWPVWDAANVKQLADEVKSKKFEEWETKYRTLMYEYRMQRSHEQYVVQQRLAGQ